MDSYSDMSYDVNESDNVTTSSDDLYSDTASGTGSSNSSSNDYLTINDIQNLNFGETITIYNSNNLYKNYYTHIGGLSGLMSWNSRGDNVQFTFELYDQDHDEWFPLNENGLCVPLNKYHYEFSEDTLVGCNGAFYY